MEIRQRNALGRSVGASGAYAGAGNPGHPRDTRQPRRKLYRSRGPVSESPRGLLAPRHPCGQGKNPESESEPAGAKHRSYLERKIRMFAILRVFVVDCVRPYHEDAKTQRQRRMLLARVAGKGNDDIAAENPLE